jgi:hypothetical protein
MTIEQRLEHLEQQNQRTQRTNKRLTIALTMMAVVVCAVVTMAATGDKISDFDIVRAGHIAVTNEAGEVVVTLGANDIGDGVVWTHSSKNNALVALGSTAGGGGTVTTYQPNGKELVDLTETDDGGSVSVYNKTGERIVQMFADEYGNGVVWAGNRKGIGRTLKPGP